ncbi:MAG: hypothetical protein CVV34_03650 [Methanomicrobiales archaeon HGW-Methanomicrobiales-5]|nr:MAG: hypothetical protein CVV34_03650 [Methanomicrobiales archaeon HGW-Methanomicrobiales-5]
MCCQRKEHILNKGYGFSDEFICNMNDVFSGLVIVSYSSNLSTIPEIARQRSGGWIWKCERKISWLFLRF